MQRRHLKIICLTIFIYFCIFSHAKARILTLSEAVKLALKNYPALKSLQYKLISLSYKKKAIKTKRWIKIDFEVQAQRYSEPITLYPISQPGKFPPFTQDLYSWNLIFSFPIYQGGSLSEKVKLSNLESLLTKTELFKTKEDLVATVKTLYFQIIYLESTKAKEITLLKELKKERDLAFLRYKAGKAPYLDLLHFDTLLKEEEALVNKVSYQLELSKKLLAIIIGLNSLDFKVKGSLKTNLNTNFKNNNLFLLKRPDVKLAFLRIKKSETEIKLAKSAFLPRLYIFGSYGQRFDSGFHDQKEMWSFGIGLKFNIFSSGERIYTLLQKKEELLSAKSYLNAVMLKAKQSVMSAITEIKTAMSNIKLYESEIRFAKEAYLKEVLKYNKGVGSVMDVTDSHQRWLKAELALLKAEFELKKALINYQLQTAQILNTQGLKP